MNISKRIAKSKRRESERNRKIARARECESERARARARACKKEGQIKELPELRERARRERETKNDYACMHASNAETEEADL